MGLADIAVYTVKVITHTAMPRPMAQTISAVKPGVRAKLFSARRK
jgi:hypothetical protein